METYRCIYCKSEIVDASCYKSVCPNECFEEME